VLVEGQRRHATCRQSCLLSTTAVSMYELNQGSPAPIECKAW